MIPLSHEHGFVGGIVGNSRCFVTLLFGLVHVVGNWLRQCQYHLLSVLGVPCLLCYYLHRLNPDTNERTMQSNIDCQTR